MKIARGHDSNDNRQNREKATTTESIRGRYAIVSNPELEPPLTLDEEAELDSIFSEYDEFARSINRSRDGVFDPCQAVLPLQEALKTANLLVDCMRHSQSTDDSSERGCLHAQLLDCEEKAAELIGRLSRLRRGMNDGRSASAC